RCGRLRRSSFHEAGRSMTALAPLASFETCSPRRRAAWASVAISVSQIPAGPRSSTSTEAINRSTTPEATAAEWVRANVPRRGFPGRVVRTGLAHRVEAPLVNDRWKDGARSVGDPALHASEAVPDPAAGPVGEAELFDVVA